MYSSIVSMKNIIILFLSSFAIYPSKLNIFMLLDESTLVFILDASYIKFNSSLKLMVTLEIKDRCDYHFGTRFVLKCWTFLQNLKEVSSYVFRVLPFNCSIYIFFFSCVTYIWALWFACARIKCNNFHTN